MNYLQQLKEEQKIRKSRESDDLKMKELVTKIQNGRSKYSTKFLTDLENYLTVYEFNNKM